MRAKKLLDPRMYEHGPRGKSGLLTQGHVEDIGDDLLAAFDACPDVVPNATIHTRLKNLLEWAGNPATGGCYLSGNEARTIQAAMRLALPHLRKRRDLTPAMREKRVRKLYRVCGEVFGKLSVHDIDVEQR